MREWRGRQLVSKNWLVDRSKLAIGDGGGIGIAPPAERSRSFAARGSSALTFRLDAGPTSRIMVPLLMRKSCFQVSLKASKQKGIK